MSKVIGCTKCPYAGHIELKECPNAYTEVSKNCGLYKNEPIGEETVMSHGRVVPDMLQGWRYEEKPTDEWNYIQLGMCVCPFCGAMPHKLYKNFCAKCGAKLKESKEEE